MPAGRSRTRPADGDAARPTRASRRCSTSSPRPSRRPPTTRTPRCRPTSPTSTPPASSAASRCAGSGPGVLRRGQQVAWCTADGTVTRVKITELLRTEALTRVPAESASAGDLVAVAGIAEVTIGDTLADPDNPVPLPRIHVDEPAIAVTIGINTSPLVGRDPHPGTKLTARQVKGRLDAELVGNVVAARAAHRAPGRLGGAGPRRAGAGRARGDHAPGGLRADRRQARGRHPHDRRQAARAVRAAVGGRAHRAPRRRHPAARRAQGRAEPDGARRDPGADGLPRARPRADRLPHRVPDDHPRRGHRQPRLRRLRPVGRRAAHPPARLAGRRPRRARSPPTPSTSSPTAACCSSGRAPWSTRAW